MDRFLKLAYVGMITATLIAAGLYLYPLLDPLRPLALARAVVLRGTLFVFGVVAMLAALALTDLVTPGDWLDRVGHDPLSSSILLSALVAGLAWMFCYA